MAAERSTKRKPADDTTSPPPLGDPVAQWDGMTVPELRAIAANRGLSIGNESSKAEIVAALVAAGIDPLLLLLPSNYPSSNAIT